MVSYIPAMVTSLESPKSFKLERKSSAASKLKKLVSDKLSRIFPDYSDDVLAEYITVLVCNGKNQNQARIDLEEFLGERTEDFVSWLWGLPLNGEPQSAMTTFSNQKGRTSASPCDRDVDKDVGAERVQDLQGLKTDSVDRSLLKDKEVKVHRASNGVVQYNDTKQKELKLNTLMTQTCVSQNQGHFVNDDSVRYFYLVPSSGEETLSANSLGKIENSKCNGLPNPRASLPSKEAFSRTSSASLSEAHARQHTAGTAKRSVSPTRITSLSHQNKKRCSVWDRLGRPPVVAPIEGRTNTVYGDGVLGYNEVPVHQHSLPIPASIDMCVGGMRDIGRFSEEGWNFNGSGGSHHVNSTVSGVPDINNIRRNRQFSEINGYHGTGLVSRMVDGHSEKSSQSDKTSKSAVEASQAVVSQLHDWKLRMLQIENEISKLQKQVEMDKGRKTIPLSDLGTLKPIEEDMESRTVLVTNVHFVATKEALSLYFSKCGKVVNVVLLTDKLPSFPQRSAYITFASKESAEKALGLSGMCFYSRAIKVLKKGETAAASKPLQFTGNQSQAKVSHMKKNVAQDKPYYPSSHLQWRRYCIGPTMPECLVSTNDRTIGTTTSTTASQQQPSVSPVSHNIGNLCEQRPSSGLDKAGEVEIPTSEAAGF